MGYTIASRLLTDIQGLGRKLGISVSKPVDWPSYPR